MTLHLHGRVRRGGLALDIELDLPPGLTAVTGANGTGKTTLLRTIAGLEMLDEGSLTVDDLPLDAAGHHVPAHQRPVAMMFQEHRLFGHLDAADNVAFAARRRGASRRAARGDALERLAAVGMADHATTRPSNLSLGQQQRVALARTLATPARVLLFDEPFAAIDDVGRTTLRSLMTDAAPYVVWVTHDPADATDADHRVSVTDGRVRQTLHR